MNVVATEAAVWRVLVGREGGAKAPAPARDKAPAIKNFILRAIRGSGCPQGGASRGLSPSLFECETKKETPMISLMSQEVPAKILSRRSQKKKFDVDVAGMAHNKGAPWEK